MLLGFVCVSLVTTGSLLNGLAMCLLGVLLGQIGTDLESGTLRFTLGLAPLMDGVSVVSVALGCFGIAEICRNSMPARTARRSTARSADAELARVQAHHPSALRGSVVGSVLGILPAAVRRSRSSPPTHRQEGLEVPPRDRLGIDRGRRRTGGRDEAAARTSFIPLMSIGIPENAVMALMMAAFIIKGIQPGPNMIAKHPDLFWGSSPACGSATASF